MSYMSAKKLLLGKIISLWNCCNFGVQILMDGPVTSCFSTSRSIFLQYFSGPNFDSVHVVFANFTYFFFITPPLCSAVCNILLHMVNLSEVTIVQLMVTKSRSWGRCVFSLLEMLHFHPVISELHLETWLHDSCITDRVLCCSFKSTKMQRKEEVRMTLSQHCLRRIFLREAWLNGQDC